MKLPSSSRAFATLILLVAGVSLSVLAQKEVVAPVKPETGAGRCRSNASILATKSGAAGWPDRERCSPPSLEMGVRIRGRQHGVQPACDRGGKALRGQRIRKCLRIRPKFGLHGLEFPSPKLCPYGIRHRAWCNQASAERLCLFRGSTRCSLCPGQRYRSVVMEGAGRSASGRYDHWHSAALAGTTLRFGGFV
jgi:hypothetical protein